MTHELPQAYRFAGLHCGIKKNTSREDLSLVVSDRPAVGVGVFTKNLVQAAPVLLNRQRTPSESIRAVVTNSGVANACTGDRGLADARRMAEITAATIGCEADDVLVQSTGVIGVFLPLEKIATGIEQAARRLAADEPSLVAAARGMMTTDTVHKLSSRTIEVAGRAVGLLGVAKGAAMIAPNMATMLAVIVTDAALKPAAAQQSLTAAVEETFNCISIDGHMSTNDTVLLLANGAATGEPLGGDDLDAFQAAVVEVCAELAHAIVDDGEGASHTMTIDVIGCASRDDARRIAREIGESPLVKTALAGADPNWGRIISAAGYSGVDLDPDKLDLTLNDVLLYKDGAPTTFDAAAVSQSMRERRDSSIVLNVNAGSERVRFLATDLTAEYVRLNADYTT